MDPRVSSIIAPIRRFTSNPATTTFSAIIAISPTTAACGDWFPEKYIYGKAVFRYWPDEQDREDWIERRQQPKARDAAARRRRVFRGKGHGFEGEAVGEVVFNTSMTGYQEILTDPSYAGQIVTMTYPMIGNTGINPEDIESRKPFLEAFIVRRMSPIAEQLAHNRDSRRLSHAQPNSRDFRHRHPCAGAAHPRSRVRCAGSFR